jgi:hypothetical protein
MKTIKHIEEPLKYYSIIIFLLCVQVLSDQKYSSRTQRCRKNTGKND